MSRQKKAWVTAQANNKSQTHSTTTRPISKYRAKQYHTAMGAAMREALKGGQL